MHIEDLLKEGQEIMVQVAKDPIGTKGCRVTTNISLPGRHLVYMPYIDHIGISRRITEESERSRLRDLMDKIRPTGSGFIVRTVAEGMNEKKLRADVTLLVNLWKKIQVDHDKSPAPVILHYDMNLVFRAVRDLFTSDIDRLVCGRPRSVQRNHPFHQDLHSQLQIQPRIVRRQRADFRPLQR